MFAIEMPDMKLRVVTRCLHSLINLYNIFSCTINNKNAIRDDTTVQGIETVFV